MVPVSIDHYVQCSFVLKILSVYVTVHVNESFNNLTRICPVQGCATMFHITLVECVWIILEKK